MHEFQSSSIFQCSVQTLREFLGQPENFPEVSDPELELEIVSAPVTISEGDTIEFRITAYGFKQRATHKYVTVSELEIVEEQIDGPMRHWRHRQCYVALDEASCKLVDEVQFEPPGGMLGFVLTESKIKDSLAEGMQARYESLARLLEGR